MKDMLIPDDREPKLPTWARNDLASLRRRVETLERIATELRGDIPNSDTFVRDWPEPDRPLPAGAKIAFRNRTDWPIRHNDVLVYFDERGRLTVQGDRGLRISPQASNAFRIEIEE